MFFRTLSAKITSGPNKDKANTVDITSSAREKTVIDEKTGAKELVSVKYVIPAEKFSYPQFGQEPTLDVNGNELPLTEDQAKEGIDEAAKSAGSYVELLDVLNSATATMSLNKGKNKIRLNASTTLSDDEIIADGLATTHDYSLAKTERVSTATIKSQAGEILAKSDSMSKEDLVAALEAMLGKKS